MKTRPHKVGDLVGKSKLNYGLSRSRHSTIQCQLDPMVPGLSMEPHVWSFVMYERPILDDEPKAHFAGKTCIVSLPHMYCS